VLNIWYLQAAVQVAHVTEVVAAVQAAIEKVQPHFLLEHNQSQ